MGTRLDEALLNKCETLGEETPGPTLANEEEHLINVRTWLSESVLDSAQV